MKTTLLTVGRTKPPFADDVAHYRKLLSRYQAVDLVEARDERQLLRKLPGEGRLAAIDGDRTTVRGVGGTARLAVCPTP